MSKKAHSEVQTETQFETLQAVTTRPTRRSALHQRAEGVRRVVKTVELEPEAYIRVALTMPSDLLTRVDEASKLYGFTRSKLIQEACEAYVVDLVGTDALRQMLQNTSIKKGSPTGYDVDALIDEMSYQYIPGLTEPGVDLFLTPEHLQIIKKDLEPEKTIRGKNKWLEL